jgi:hypothetical protein
VQRRFSFGACLVLAGCAYDFSVPAEQNRDPCQVRDLTTVVCDDVERPGAAYDPGLYADRSETPSIVRDGSQVLEFDPADHRSEWLKTPPTGDVSRIRFAFALKVAELPRTGPRQIAPLRFGTPSREARIYLHLSPDGRLQLVDEFYDGNGNANTEFELPAVDGHFHAYQLDVDLSRASVSLSIDGEPALREGAAFTHLAQIGSAAPATVLLGANYAPPPAPGRESEAAVTLRFDEVLLAAGE